MTGPATMQVDPSEFLSFLDDDDGLESTFTDTGGDATVDAITSSDGPPATSFYDASVTTNSDVDLCRETVTSKPTTRWTMLLADPEDLTNLTPGLSFLRQQIEFFEASPQDVRDRFSKGGTKCPVTEGQIGFRCHHCAHLPDNMRANGAVAYPNTLSTVYQAVRNWQRFHFMKCPQISDEIKAKFKSFKRQHSAKSSTDYWIVSCQRKGLYDGDNDDPTNKGIRIEHKETEMEQEQQNTTTNLLCAIEPEPVCPTANETDDAAPENVSLGDINHADLADFIDIEPEPIVVPVPAPAPVPVHSSNSDYGGGVKTLYTTSKSKSKRSCPEDSWLQDYAAKIFNSFTAYRDNNNEDASLPSIASSCTATYSTGATMYYSASSRYPHDTEDSGSVNTRSSSRAASATADQVSALNMHRHNSINEAPGIFDSDIQLPPKDAPQPSIFLPAPPSRQGSPMFLKTRLSPDPSLGHDEELPRIDEHDEDMDNTNHTAHTAQSTSTVVHSNARLPPSTCSSSVNSNTKADLVHKVDIAHDLVQMKLDVNIFAESSTVMPPRDHNGDLVDVGRELFEHFSGFPLTDDVYRELCQAGRIGRDLDGANVIYSHLRSMGYPSSVCGLVTTLCLTSQPNYLRMANKIHPRTFSSVAEVKNELRLMLDQPDLWFFDADIHTLEDRLPPPSRNKKAKICM